MQKRIAIFFIVILSIVLNPDAFGDVQQAGKLSKLSEDEYIYTEGMLGHHLRLLTDEKGETVLYDTLRWWGMSSDAYINDAHPYTFPGDTIVCDFKLAAAPAYLISVRGIFGEGGVADFYVTDGRYDPASGDPIRGFGPNILANKTWNVQGSSGNTWEVLDFSQDSLLLPWSNDPDPANRPHWVIGYICSGTDPVQGGGKPDIYYDFNSYWLRTNMGGPGGHSWFSYEGATWFGIIYSASQVWGQYVFEAVVSYSNIPPPFINSLTQLPNTWHTGNFKSIESQIIDVGGSILDTWLFYQTQNMTNPDSVTATSINGDIYTFDIPGIFNVGDTITYWVKARDNQGRVIFSVNQPNFVIKAPQNPGAQILVVYENLDLPGGDKASSIQNFWTPVLDAVLQDSLGMQYEVWDINDNFGIDKSVINHSSFTTALAFGFGIEKIPALDWSNSVWKDFVESGKSLMIADPDYLYHDPIPVNSNYTPVPGDFLYDVFGCGAVTSNPADASGNSVGDGAIMGVAGDPISDPWAGTQIVFNFDAFLGGVNWNDFAEHNPLLPNAATVFSGVSSNRGNGVTNVNSWGGSTLYLPFSLSAIADTLPDGTSYPRTDAYKLLDRYLDWVVTDIDKPGSLQPFTYELRPNYPNPFNPSTTIAYSIKKAGEVRLNIYNLLGEKVRTLVKTAQSPNEYRVTWDGKNDAGKRVASGVYIYKLTSGDFSKSHKMILMK